MHDWAYSALWAFAILGLIVTIKTCFSLSLKGTYFSLKLETFLIKSLIKRFVFSHELQFFLAMFGMESTKEKTIE